MRNSLTLSGSEVQSLLDAGTPHVIRIKIPENDTVQFADLIRGHVSFETAQVDDKVLLKADGMPTYHLAVVVDDYLMKISHVFRGEEWLPSAPVHILLWEYLGWKQEMPQWAHLPLILKPDGNGKLSKRDGDRLGFPVYAMNWTDPKTGDLTRGFREMGFLPQAFVNLLAMLGWNDGTDQEIFTMDELIERFSMDRIHKAGAKFDFEKAKWFNAEWIKKSNVQSLLLKLKVILQGKDIFSDDDYLEKVVLLVKDRLTFLNEFWEQASFFFKIPENPDFSSVKPKWNEQKTQFYQSIIQSFTHSVSWNSTDLELLFKSQAESHGLKIGEVMLPFRIMLVGGKFGPQVFEIASLLGKEEVIKRIENGIQELSS